MFENFMYCVSSFYFRFSWVACNYFTKTESFCLYFMFSSMEGRDKLIVKEGSDDSSSSEGEKSYESYDEVDSDCLDDIPSPGTAVFTS